MVSNRHRLALQVEQKRREARADLYSFARLMFAQRRGFLWQHAVHHRTICDALMQVFRGEVSRLIINVPPRYSKTELAVVNFIAWAFGKAPDAEFIHTSYSGTLATNNSAAVRGLVRHEGYQAIFPSMALATEAKSHWTTTEGGVMYTAGVDGTMTGFGAGKHRDSFGGAIIIDDPHKADEARSDVMRKNVIDWFQNTVESRKNDPKRTPIILIMQRLHEDDLSGFLLRGGNGEKWEHVCLPAIQEDGTALWPEKHQIEDLRRMEQASPYTFAGQYMQRPAPAEGGIFKPGKIEVIDAIPANVTNWVRGWDLASTTNGDYTAGAKIGRLPDGRYLIADMTRVRCGPDERDATIVNVGQADGTRTKISIPQDPGQAGKTQVLYLTRQLAGLRVVSSPESGDKVTRAEPFAAQMNVGNVLMLRADWNESMRNELAMFPNGANDDQVDALSRAFSELIGKSPMNITDDALEFL